MKKIIIVSIALSIGLSPLSWANEQADKKTNSIHHMLSIAAESNPQIEAQRQKWLAAQYSVSSDRSFPDPMFQFVTFTDELQTRAGPLEEKYAVSQKFPFFGTRGLKGSVAEQNAFIAEQAYKSKSLMIFSAVTDAYYELYYLDQSILTTEELADQLRRFSKVAERKYSVGKNYQANVLRANVELAKILNDITTLKQERVSALAKLNSLLNRKPRESVKPFGPDYFQFSHQVENLENVALINRPEILAAKALVKRSEASRSLAARKYFPDLTVSYEVSKIGSGTTNTVFDGEDAKALGFKVNVPLWINRQSSDHKATKASQIASESLLADWKNQTLFDVSDLVTRVETAGRLVNLYRDNVLPQANEAMKSSQRGYEADHISFLELLDSIRMLLKLELEYVRYQANFVQAKAKLEKVLGVPLAQIDSQLGGDHEK